MRIESAPKKAPSNSSSFLPKLLSTENSAAGPSASPVVIVEEMKMDLGISSERSDLISVPPKRAAS
ncbi:hypothetical protein H9L15_16010 (plasmid) [Sphingomonas daechungensis]|uniref:Uncharacterized protein n=1 Tax=Sphingomonas daechungensis TaxID=1176646 RepID=A0ABX6T4X3_9SPHN|nr:hypothetical protein H9L15_16010 [Sphingomonas daechungensis]